MGDKRKPKKKKKQRDVVTEPVNPTAPGIVERKKTIKPSQQ